MKTAGLFVTLVVLISISSSCRAVPGYGYGLHIDARGASSGTHGSKFILEGASGYTDGYDGSNEDTPLHMPKPFYVATYHTIGAGGWDWASGFYMGDERPLLSAWQTITEDIYLWAAPGTPSEPMQLVFGGSVPWPNPSFELRLISAPVGVAYSGRTVWSLSDAGWIGPFPFYATTDGTTGYHFQATITAIPEPSSLIALLAGLGGLRAMVRRRGGL